MASDGSVNPSCFGVASWHYLFPTGPGPAHRMAHQSLWQIRWFMFDHVRSIMDSNGFFCRQGQGTCSTACMAPQQTPGPRGSMQDGQWMKE